MPVNAAIARIVGIRILRIDAERPAASRALESVLARLLWLLLCMFMEGGGYWKWADPEETYFQLQELEGLSG